MQVYSNSALSAEIVDWPVHMRQALALARTVITAAPNPRVGCVIVKDRKLVGEGWHAAAGQAHAEVAALRQAGAAARAATAFVTLEPCAHTGRTGPCVEALLAAGIERVVLASIDPNPSVSGKGITVLEAAGVQVYHLKDFEQDAMDLNRGYFRRHQQGLPYVRLKLAMSLDGRTALANGDSKWITGPAARADGQLLRAHSCAIVTGIGTVLADDPALTVRSAELPLSQSALQANALALSRQPLRVILDSGRRTPATARILREQGSVVIFGTSSNTTDSSAYPGNVTLKALPGAGSGLALRSVLESLAADFECNEILVEAGAILSTAFIEAGLVDELLLYIAPKLLGKDGRALVEFTGLQTLADSIEFDIIDVAIVGEAGHGDIRVTLQPRTAAGA
ncbi:MAG: bifunctional diaminohydroxyphosphoribosylaminopyrimidine deaminase/5-amino-6-(5-phosphoribosylamino)uracil reductase RibD [Gammaproteobacteria bacterium]|nr:bifunctional diaminohydroxyphosphoribosylaminopyrimidine deaminase/5-amino-6-(5-phosphoribosylamino)uracil reductase RibD [Gammaproteobacteria bacterium]